MMAWGNKRPLNTSGTETGRFSCKEPNPSASPRTGFDLEKMLCGDLNRLRFITRFSTALVAHRENVAEHVAYVCLYSYLLAQEINGIAGRQVDYGKLLEKALLHDLEEARTGDIYRPFKVSRPELKQLLHECAREEFAQVFEGVVSSPTDLGYMQRVWDTARDPSTMEGAIVAFADYLSVLAHMLQELRIANMTMASHYESMVEYVREFDGPDYDFLRPYIQQAEQMVNTLLGAKLEDIRNPQRLVSPVVKDLPDTPTDYD